MELAQYSSMFDWLPMGALRAALDGRILQTNAALCQILGYDTQEAFQQACGVHSALYTQPAEHAQFMARLYSASGQVHECRLRGQRQEVLVLERASLLRDANQVACGYEVIYECAEKAANQKPNQQAKPAIGHEIGAHESLLLSALVDSIHDHIWIIDTEGRYVVANPAFRELHGLRRDGIIGKNSTEVFDSEMADKYMQADLQMMRDKKPIVREDAIWHAPSGTVRYSELAKTPLLDDQGQCIGLAGLSRDITARKTAEAALYAKQAEMTALINGIHDHVWLIEPSGQYVMGNPSFLNAHNLQAKDLIGKLPKDIFGQERGSLYHASNLEVMKNKLLQTRQDVAPHPQTGELMYLELIKTPLINDSGECIGLVGIARDMTMHKQAEAALIAARDSAEAAERAKADFLANMSHEIRTPMNAVIGMSDLLLETNLADDQKEFAETIRSSGDQLLALINDILDFSKIESGHLTLEQAPVVLADCIETALDLTAKPAISKGLDLLYWIDDDIPRTVMGDLVRLRQIFINLINNAVKFTQHGEVVVTIKKRLAEDGSPLLHAAVRDTGIGIPADRMNRLFQVFSQVDASTTRNYGGTGLGLAISKRLVNLMGGRIWVESVVGEGSMFQFEIPLHGVATRPVAWAPSANQPLAGKRVLIVDDNATNRRILELQTTRWGMHSISADSGLSALKMLELGEVFDLILSDVQMPGMDGYTFIERTREIPAFKKTPVLVLTSIGVDPQRAEQLEISQALSKPLKSAQLMTALSRALESNATRSPPAAPKSAQAISASNPGAAAKAQVAKDYPLRILLAEDNPVNQRVATLVLSGMGYTIEVAENGLLAVQAVQEKANQGQTYDLVLMDVQMPEMDGLQATAMIRQGVAKEQQPHIVAMTANAMEGDRETCINAGMDDYISKPIRPAAIIEVMKKVYQVRYPASA